MPNPGGYALVLEPMLISPKRACTFSRVLIDGGSSINILYRDTLEKLGVSATSLQPSRMVFHGIVPGHAGSSMGHIRHDVLFGTKDNHCRESVLFEVVDHTSAYHAILGRPALAKFMAVPHYAYLKMKLPGPRGIITISGDYKRSIACATDSAKVAETMICNEELKQFKCKASEEQQGLPESVKADGETSFQSARDTKKIYFDENDKSKFVIVGANLDSK